MCESHFMKIAKLYKCFPFMAVTCAFKYCYVHGGVWSHSRKQKTKNKTMNLAHVHL